MHSKHEDGMSKLRLGVNIDHVATVRNARGSAYPDPVRAAILAQSAGADGITAHLREDRRHIVDDDIERMMDAINLPLNFEMAATDEMQAIALRHKPHAVCACALRQNGSANGVGVCRTTRIANGCNVINIHTKS
jgi:pyridoxine 5-phosphate synthase